MTAEEFENSECIMKFIEDGKMKTKTAEPFESD